MSATPEPAAAPTDVLAGGPTARGLSRRQLLGAAAAGSLAGAWMIKTAGVVQAAVPSTSRFVPVGPVRLHDTRTSGGPAPAGGSIDVAVGGQPGVPAGISAAVLNVTSVSAGADGYVTVWPSGTAQPLASSLNPLAGDTAPNLVTVPVGANGAVSIFCSATSGILVDLFGVYVPAGSANDGRFVPLGPARVLDTRQSGGKVRAGGVVRAALAAVGVPSDAVGAVLNVTATEASAPGFLTVWPAGLGRPGTSNLNVSTGDTRANQVIVPITSAGVDIFTSGGTHVVVDIAGYFTGQSAPSSTTGLFVPVAPTRLLDTRQSGLLNPLGNGVRMQPGWTVEMPVSGRAGIAAAAASAIVGNTTLVDANGAGYLTAYAAGLGQPNSSNVNASARGQVVPNHTIVPISSRGAAFYLSGGGHVLFDVAGYFTGTPPVPSGGLRANPPIPVTQFPVGLVVPRLGLSTRIAEGIDDATLASGPGHWPGTALPGQAGNAAVFGHRVSHTHPFRYLDQMAAGDLVEVQAGSVLVRYQVSDVWITGGDDLSVVQQTSMPCITLVACHPPGSIAYRIVVRANQFDIIQS